MNMAANSFRVLRGASWYDYDPYRLLASFRRTHTPNRRGADAGFRCVVFAVRLASTFLPFEEPGGSRWHSCPGSVLKKVGTRSRLIRGSVPNGHVRCTASDDSCTPARPGSPVWNVSEDVLRRTRRNAETLSGAVPEVNSGRPAAVRAGARPYQRIGIA
jgi:hypothetical protein